MRSRLTVYRCRAEEAPTGADVVTIDPPYQGATVYPDAMPRPAVIGTALRHAAAGSKVLVCEREPLDLPEWAWRDMSLRPDRREWVGVWK